MRKNFVKRVQSSCRAYFRRKHTRGKSVERAELSCRTCFGKMNGILSPREWVDIARGAGVRAIAIMDFQDAAGFQEAAQAAEELRGEAEPEELDFKMLYGMETVLEDGCPVHLLVRRQEGLAQLYRLLEISWQDREEQPFLRKAEIGRHNCIPPSHGGSIAANSNSFWLDASASASRSGTLRSIGPTVDSGHFHRSSVGLLFYKKCITALFRIE